MRFKTRKWKKKVVVERGDRSQTANNKGTPKRTPSTEIFAIPTLVQCKFNETKRQRERERERRRGRGGGERKVGCTQKYRNKTL
jgi:hypothetical protein